MTANATTYDPVIREMWPQRRIKNLTYQKAPFWALLKKDETFSEKTRHIALQYANPQGRSRTFANAQGNTTSSRFEDFELRRKMDFGVGRIDGDTYETTMSNRAAIVSAIETETKGALMALKRSLHRSLYGDGTAVLGVVGSISTDDITLATPADAKNFEVGQEIVFADTAAGALRDSGDAATVVAVDRNDGIISFAAGEVAAVSGATTGDFMITQGDAQAGASSPLSIHGLNAWLPLVLESGNFLGVDRSQDRVRLAGALWIADTEGTTTLEDTLIQANAKLDDISNGSMADVCLVNPRRFGELAAELSSRKEYGTRSARDAEISFKTLKMHGATGEIDIISDFQCGYDDFYMLQMDTWTFHSWKGVPRIIQYEGLSRTRVVDDDAVEFRAIYRGELCCDAPGYSLRGQFPT